MFVHFKDQLNKYNIDMGELCNLIGIDNELIKLYVSWNYDFYDHVLDSYRLRYIKKRQMLG